MADRSVYDQMQDVLNRLARAHKRGTGCRLTAQEMHILSVSQIGAWWGQPDPREDTTEPLAGAVWNGPNTASQVDPRMALPHNPARKE